jgi:hypothetical protein
VPGIHVFLCWAAGRQDVEGRDKPGHDEVRGGDNSTKKSYPRSEIRTYLVRTLLTEGRFHEAS